MINEAPYPSDPPRLSEGDGLPPNYAAVLDRMQVLGMQRAVSLDIWARGNYTKRLIAHARSSTPPIVVPCRSVGQMRWAYRRLALLGLPADFIYTGALSPPTMCFTACPIDTTAMDCGGWGYTAMLGLRVDVGGREHFRLMGWSQLMPNPVVDWLVDEVPDAFVRGDVFIAPADLVGISPRHARAGAEVTAEIAGGRVLRHMAAAQILMSLEIPSVEDLSPKAFEKFLSESVDDLVRFRVAFKRLIDHDGVVDLDDVVSELRAEVAAMRNTRRYAGMRRNVNILGGVLATAAAGVTGTVAARPDVALPVAASAAAAAATACLVDLWKQQLDARGKVRDNPFALLWQLGVDDVAKVDKREAMSKDVRRSPRARDNRPKPPGDLHWLCPPSPGLVIPTIKAS